jgi:hypothetical protein
MIQVFPEVISILSTISLRVMSRTSQVIEVRIIVRWKFVNIGSPGLEKKQVTIIDTTVNPSLSSL